MMKKTKNIFQHNINTKTQVIQTVIGMIVFQLLTFISAIFLARGLNAEHLGKLAANELIIYIKKEIPVDNYLSDQLIPFMGFVEETSRIKVLELTNHTKTNLELIKLFLKRNFRILKENNHYIIEI